MNKRGILVFLAIPIFIGACFGLNYLFDTDYEAGKANHFLYLRKQIIQRLAKIDTLRNVRFEPKDFINLEEQKLRYLYSALEYSDVQFFAIQEFSQDEAIQIPGTDWNIIRTEKQYIAFRDQKHLVSQGGKTKREVLIALPSVWETTNIQRHLILMNHSDYLQFTCIQEVQETEKKSVRTYDLSVNSTYSTRVEDEQAQEFYVQRAVQGMPLFNPPCKKPQF